MDLLRTFVQHALAVYLLSVVWTRGRRPTRRPLPATGRQWRLYSYWATIGWQWAFVTVLLLVVPLSDIVDVPGGAIAERHWHPQLVFIVAGNIVAGLYGPVVLAWSNPVLRRRVLAPFAPVQALLPTTASERIVWIGFSLTTGICEELMFRGFVLQYLTRAPFGCSFGLSTLITCVIFGLGHAYQGWRGVLRTMLFGAAMSGLLIATGNLIFPIIVHTLVNIRMALMPSVQRSAPAVTG